MQNERKRKVSKETVGGLGEERSESRKQLTVCENYDPPGLRGSHDVKGYVWGETQRADRMWFSGSEILKCALPKGRQL